jgi:hypothetical protein
MSTTPYELLAGPALVYLAPVGTTFPVVDLATPAAPWAALAWIDTSVTATFDQTIEQLRVPAVSTLPKKPFRTEATPTIAFDLASLTVENFAKILNGATVTDTAAGAGTAGHRSFPIEFGNDVPCYAMLIRIPSAYGNWKGQWEFANVYQSGSPAVAHDPEGKSLLTTEWILCEDPSNANRVGVLRMQDAVPV